MRPSTIATPSAAYETVVSVDIWLLSLLTFEFSEPTVFERELTSLCFAADDRSSALALTGSWGT